MAYMFALLALLSTACLQAKTLKVMQYNAENFFDTKYDEGTDDYTYLPLSVKKELPGHQEKCEALGKPHMYDCLNMDWNETVFSKKLQNIAKVIKTFNPDVLVMEEIENINVLNQLVSNGLSGMGYTQVLLIEGDDSRGIDVGIISKYPIKSSKHHSIFSGGKKLNTRGITEATLDVNGETVVIFGNHWPSQNNPVAHRVDAAKLLEKIADAKKGDLILAMGDFNVIAHDSPYPFTYLSNFTDSEAEARKIRTDIHPGTQYFRGQWSSLDKIFIHRNSTLKADFNSYKIIINDFQMERDPKTGMMAPKRFNIKSGDGYSDHLPVGLEFTL